MSNFTFLQSNKDFALAAPAEAAERILHIDPVACVFNCRRAMKYAVKWMCWLAKVGKSYEWKPKDKKTDTLVLKGKE